MKYNLGLDLGITSIGWAVIGLDDEEKASHIIDANVTIVESVEDAKGKLANTNRRDARGARRTIRRRAFRVKRTKQLLKEKFNLDIETIYNIKHQVQLNPYTLKVKGLQEKLTAEELAICLIHYVKHRGYKSNRKNENDSNTDGKALTGIAENEAYLKTHNLTVSQYMHEHLIALNGAEKIKNCDNNYKFLFNRQTVLAEIEQLLEKQIDLGLIDEKFKKQYLNIWASQRHFSEGPGGNSPYKVSFDKLFGYCKFEIDGEKLLRAPKMAPTTEIFRLLQKLNNLSYDYVDENGETIKDARLTTSEIEKLVNTAKETENIKYSHIDKVINKDKVYFNNLDVDKKQFINYLNDYKKKYNIANEEKVDTKEISFKLFFNKKQLERKFDSLKGYHTLKKSFKDQGHLNDFKTMPIEYLDDLATCLTFFKTDERINNYFSQEDEKYRVTELDWQIYAAVIKNVVPYLPSQKFSESANLSLKLMRKLNLELLKGVTYDKAMENLGFDHSKPIYEIKKQAMLPSIQTIMHDFPNELNNPRVIRVLGETNKLINSIIDKYGLPQNINIEAARDIANKKSKRLEMQSDMLSNFEYNSRLKNELLREYANIFKAQNEISKRDLERIKLYKEQEGICMYSNRQIPSNKLFSSELQVDHIIPYSLSFNDSFSNKTLVYASENQEKTNKIPYEYMKNDKEKWSKFCNLVNSSYRIKNNKRKMYLATEITDDFKTRSLNDTRIITKYLKKVFETYLNIEGKVEFFNATTLNMLKKSWNINNFVHSLESPTYKPVFNEVYSDYKLDKKSLALTIKNLFTQDEMKIQISLVDEKEKTPEFLKEQNKALKTVVANDILLKELATKFEDKTLYEIYDFILKDESLNTDLKSAFLIVFNKLKTEYDKNKIKKNRNNHLHHTLDAITCGVTTKKLLVNVTNFHHKLEMIRAEAKSYLDKNKTYYLEDSDEAITDFEQLEKHLQKCLKNKFPLPYEKFYDEVKYRVYELNSEKQQELFKEHFNDDLKRNIRPILPVYKAKKRTSGALHKETIHGKTLHEGKKYLTKRIPISEATIKNIEKIVDKDYGAKQTYIAVKEWLHAGSEKSTYPTLSNGRPIKKIKILDNELSKSIKVGTRGYASTDEIARIDIYKSPNDNKYYFVQRTLLNIIHEKKGLNPLLTLWWGQDNNHKHLSFNELNEQYKCVLKLHPGDLINISTNNGNGYSYVVGFTSGKFEVKSVLGDAYDLLINGLTGKIKSQYQITVSTITNIEKIYLNNLGELS